MCKPALPLGPNALSLGPAQERCIALCGHTLEHSQHTRTPPHSSGIDRSHSWVNPAYAPGGPRAVLRRNPNSSCDLKQASEWGANRMSAFIETTTFLPPAARHVARKLLHEELALQWVVSTSTVREAALQQAWFFFQIM
ncbi:dedicator of cytokinesis protein 7-like, partial [Brachyhypopomus gauderio]|uniref:dedicator of cytokinesis protein 7-like n=1 Tax=Brachyhypopomus gauderio TaxID=698409 RepID=UPI004042842D